MEEVFFPHPELRKIQKAMVAQIAATIRNKGSLLIHAPAGIGKTAASIAPALTLALKDDSTVFFLTPKHTQHKIAVETLRQIRERHKLKFDAVDFIGKKWMCSLPGVQTLSASEFSEYCKEMREKENCEFFLNFKQKNKLSAEAKKLFEELKKEGPMHVEELTKKCTKHKICPYEMACLIGKDAKVIIADYYHLLHAGIRDTLLKRLEKEVGKCIIIFDEGHSLPSRARELMSSGISNVSIDFAIREAKELGYSNIVNDLEALKKLLQKVTSEKTRIDSYEALVAKNDFVEGVEKIGSYEEMQGNFKFVGEQVLETKKRSYSNGISHFMELWKGPDEGFVRVVEKGFTKSGKPMMSLSYKCLDPSIILKPLTENCKSFIAMSGTLTPTEMYKELFGLGDDTTTVEYENPFPKENRLNIIWPETTTKYTTRGDEMYQAIALKCADIANAIPGNSAFFFPSYKLRDDVYYHFRGKCEKTIFLEERNMNKTEKNTLLESFKSYKDSGAVLFAVITGNFSEGIDLPGDFLKAVTIAGLPLGKPDLETQELIKYYDKKFKKGWDYGYVYPAIIRTMQGAGRCIRSSKDRGVIVFLDERYAWRNYMGCFPPDWNMIIENKPIPKIVEFFKAKTE